MATSLYLVGDQCFVHPTAGDKATNLPKATNTAAAGSAVEGCLTTWYGGSGNVVNRTVNTTGTAVNQSYYFGRFSSLPLAAQTIPAQNWNWASIVGEASNSANTFIWPVMYVWRPSDNTVVGYIFDAAAPPGTEIGTTPASATRNYAGASVTSQEGDLLVVEAWMSGTPTAAVFLQTWRITDKASFISSPYTILFKPQTSLWVTTATATVAPTAGTKASNLPLAQNASAAAGELVLEITTPPNDTNQQPRTVSTLANTNPQSGFYGRFSTVPLAAQTIPVQDWGWELSVGETNASANIFWWPVLYVWRPSTNAVVGYIFNAAGPQGEEWYVNADPKHNQVFTGASVTLQDGDILVVEVWGAGSQGAATSYGPTMWINSFNSKLRSPYVIKVNSSLTTLQENFEAPLDTAKWTANQVGATVTFTGGEGVFTHTSTTAGSNAAIASTKNYDFRDGSAYVKVVQPPRWAGDPEGNEFSFVVESTGNNRLAWALNSNGQLAVVKFTNDVWAALKIETMSYYSAVDTYTWLRLRETAGTTYAESAPSTASNPPIEGDWVVRHSVATSALPIVAGAIKGVIRLWVNTPAAGLPTQPLIVDGFNIAANATGPRGTLTKTEDPDTISSGATLGPVPRNATLTVTEASNTISATATVVPFPVINATLTQTEATDVLDADTSAVSIPKLSTLQEDFEAPADPGKWDTTNVLNGTTVFQNGVGEFSVTSTVNGTHASLISVGNFDFKDSSVFWKVVRPTRWTADVGGGEFSLAVETPGNNRIDWTIYSNGDISAIKFTNNTWGQVALIDTGYYSKQDTYRWLRTRETAGTTYWESAPSTASNPPIEADWVIRHSVATNTLPINAGINNAKAIYRVWVSNAAIGAMIQTGQIDGFNTAASVTTGPSTGTLALTEAPNTLVATAGATAGATLTRTEAPDTIAATAGGTAGATLTRTESPDTIAATASSGMTANLTRTEAPDTIVATASSPTGANLGITEAGDTVVATAGAVATGTLTLTEAPDTIAATAQVLPFPTITANLTVQEAPDQVASASGSPAAIADLARTEAPDTLVATATSTIGATLTRTEAPDAISASARVVAGASLARTEAADSLASSATAPATGNLSKTEFNDTISSIVRSVVVGALSIQEAGDTLASDAIVRSGVEAGLTVTEGPDTLGATATVADPISYANLNVTEAGDTLMGYTHHAKKRVILVT